MRWRWGALHRSAHLSSHARSRPRARAQVHNGYFVDLFVRKSNAVAIGMYEKFGYIKYREVRAALDAVQCAEPLNQGASSPSTDAQCTLLMTGAGAGLLQRRGERVRHAQGHAAGRAQTERRPADQARAA